MRSWFRDLFRDSFETQKLGGFDPYMNEFVLSSNSQKLPQPSEVRQCGYVLNMNLTPVKKEITVDYSTIIGQADIDYDVTGNVNIQVVWNNNLVVNSTVTGSGTVSFNKTANTPTEAYVTITPINGEATFQIEFKCPSAPELTVKEIVINFAGDVNLTTTCRYRWSLGNQLSPYSTNILTLEQDGVSLFNESTGPSSFGSIPSVGATVIMKNRQNPGQTFVFDPASDKFKYLVSNVNYDEADLNTLLPLLNTATPITGSAPEYEASFTYSSQADYMYLVWDLREPTLLEFCYDATSPSDACCECDEPTDPV